MKKESKKVYNTYVDDSLYKKIKLQSLLKKTLLVMLLILVGNFLVAKIFNYNLLEDIGKRVLKLAGIYTEAVPRITLESDGWKEQEEGSYQIIKSAKWNGRNEAKITLEVKSIASINSAKDVIFVLDKSYSMQGEKLQKLKDDALELTDMMLKDEKLHKIALVTFSTDSEIVTSFTRDKTTIDNAINGMVAEGTTNYNAALKNVLKILQEVNYKQQERRDLVILFLTDGQPCEDTPNEVGTYALLKEQYPYSIVNGVEYEMGNSISYQLTRISDKQFNAKISNLSNVLLEAAIIPDKYEEFTITDTINSEYFEIKDKADIKVSANSVNEKNKFDLVNENGKQKVVWDLTENYVSGARITMEIKVYLKDQYEHEDEFYPVNSSLDVISKIPTKNSKTRSTTDSPVLQLAYNVIYDTNPPLSCNNIKAYNKERHFIFENVTKKTEKPTCDGYIFKGWEVVENDVTQINDEVFVMPEHDVQVRATWSKPMITKNMEGTVNEKINLYRTIENEFKSGSKYVAQYTGEIEDSYANPYTNENIYYYHGAATTNNVIFGGFCWQIIRTTKTGGVKIIYNGVASGDNKCGSSSKYLSKSSAFNKSSNSPSDVGYMYNNRYSNQITNLYTQIHQVLETYYGMNSEYTYWFSQNFTYDESTKQYTLVEPESHIWGDMNIKDYKGWYFCTSRDTKSCSTLYYLVGSNNCFGSLRNGDQERVKYTFGKSYTKDDSGNYILQEIEEVDNKDWGSNYNKYNGYYTCSDFKSSICSKLYYIGYTSYDGGFGIIDMNKLFGNSFTYANGEYTLSDAKTYDELKGDFSFNHYTCSNNTRICSTIEYIYYVDSGTLYTIELSDGKSVENALEDMLWSDDVNQTDSTVKSTIDSWYKENIEGRSVENYIEDAIYCNDRSIRSLGGWNPNGGKLINPLDFGAYGRIGGTSVKLTCEYETDKFSISNPKAKLKYPIGLITLDEMMLAGNKSNDYLTKAGNWWLGSPYFFTITANVFYAHSSGTTNYSVNSYSNVRPAISLRPNVEYSAGTGTTNDPYIISVGE